MEKEPIYDMQAALNAFGDVSVVKEALEVYLTEADGMLARMRTAVKDDDHSEMRKVVHWLRGGLSYLHAPRVRKACLELDERVAAHDPSRDNPEIGEAFARLEEEMHELQRFVEKEGYAQLNA